jgi:hypothetical protein
MRRLCCTNQTKFSQVCVYRLSDGYVVPLGALATEVVKMRLSFSPCLSLLSLCDNSRAAERIFTRFDTGDFYSPLLTQASFDWYWTALTGSLHKTTCILGAGLAQLV